MRNQLYESIELSPECTFKMRRPDWNTHEKSAFFNTMRQMRLALLETHAASLAVIEKQKGARKKLNRDLLKAKEVLQHLEELKKTTPANGARRMAIDYSYVDSDVFDSFSKQLIPAEALLADVRARLEKVNLIITNEEKSTKIIRHYVQGFAATKLQQSVRDFLRSHRWKLAWQDFKDNVQLAAVVTIQTSFRMLRAKQTRWFLEEVRRNHHMEAAAAIICRFFRAILQQRQVRVTQLLGEARRQAKQRQRDALLALEYAVSRILCCKALQHWQEKQRQATAQQQRHIVGSVVTIQRMYRGFRDRLQWKRIRLLNTLSPPVRVLVDHFLVSGNFWGFVLEIDTAYRRFEHDKRVEDEDALTFVSTLLRQRKREEDQMMQSPIVHGAHQTQSAYLSASPASSSSLSTDSLAASSTDSSLSQTLLESPMAADLIALSPNKRKTDVFPTDLPPKVIRHAMAQGFALDEIIAVLRGLQAQKKDIQDVHLVVKALAQRTPLMTNPWKSERLARHEACPRYNGPGDEKNNEDDSRHTNRSYAVQKQKPMLGHHIKKAPKNPALRKQPEPFVSENLIASIPGGLNAPIARILFVAALKSFDPDADGDGGAFTLPEDFTIDPFQSYLQLENPLLKIRREHRALEASKPFLAQFTENRCLTGYDVLYNVRGVDELVSWKIPRPLALSIYDVLEQIHRQMTHLSTRNIRREMFISPAFEHFLHARVSEKANKPKETAISTSSKEVATGTQHHFKKRIVHEVLLGSTHSKAKYESGWTEMC
uniref:Uncharacterized protein n=1 Tax=Globisporangium ultimum (strain ATCC 200006 / CBS 805.95 / DAOM BR144) TaxID=431595 RepID=K3WGE0_GLOUD